jgi:predicted transposase YbfD/YdcC
LLRLLDLKGCIVTVDAIGCQKEIAQQIVDQEADYLLAVKGNQDHLLEDIELFFRLAEANDFAKVHDTSARTVNKGHGRLEIRHCWVISGEESVQFLRDYALNLLKLEKTAKGGIHNKRMQAAWNEQYLVKVLSSSMR